MHCRTRVLELRPWRSCSVPDLCTVVRRSLGDREDQTTDEKLFLGCVDLAPTGINQAARDVPFYL